MLKTDARITSFLDGPPEEADGEEYVDGDGITGDEFTVSGFPEGVSLEGSGCVDGMRDGDGLGDDVGLEGAGRVDGKRADDGVEDGVAVEVVSGQSSPKIVTFQQNSSVGQSRLNSHFCAHFNKASSWLVPQ